MFCLSLEVTKMAGTKIIGRSIVPVQEETSFLCVCVCVVSLWILSLCVECGKHIYFHPKFWKFVGQT